MSRLAVDVNAEKIQAPMLGGAAHHITFSASSVAEAFTNPRATILHTFYATQNCYIKMGKADVVATTSDTFIPAGASSSYTRDLNDTHIAVLQATTGGVLHFAEGKI